MFYNFINWYSKKFIKYPFVVILSTIVAFFAAIGSAYGGINAIQDINNMLFQNRTIVAKLEKIDTELNVNFTDKLLGTPVIQRPLGITEKLINLNERIYTHKKYFVHIISDKDGSILAYSIIIKDKSLRPHIPIGISNQELKLGQIKLTDLNSEPYKISMDISSKYIWYTEAHYFGYLGNYRDYLFGYSPDGCTIGEYLDVNLIAKFVFEEKDNINNPEVIRFREEVMPNSFTVISTKAEDYLKEDLIDGMIGPDYYDVRNL